MKNQEKDNIKYGNELVNLLGKTLGEIKAMVESDNLVWKDLAIIKDYYNYDYKSKLENSSKRTIKRLNRQLWYWKQNPNLASANRLFHFIKISISNKKRDNNGNWDYELKSLEILPSYKEQKIQKKRKIWKSLRDQADLALNDYKKEKGNFYKVKMQNLQLKAA